MLKLLISFKTAFLSMQEKLKFETWWRKRLMEIMLGWFLYLKTAFRVGWLFIFKCKSSPTSYLGISRFLTILEKKLLRQFATSASSETKFSSSIKVIFSLDLVFSERKGLIVCQNFLLSVMSFSFRWANYFFFSFRNSETRQFFCLL